jgi:hypothetical protein
MRPASGGGTKDGESCQKTSWRPVISNATQTPIQSKHCRQDGEKGQGVECRRGCALAAADSRLDCPAGKNSWRLLRYEVVASGRITASTVGREAIREMSRRLSSVISEPDQQDNHRGHGQVVDLL